MKKWLFFGKSTSTQTNKTARYGTSNATQTEPDKRTDFRAVTIMCHKKRGCRPVLELAGKVYLCDDAPWLPLVNCNKRDQCKCYYSHQDDRRTELRRDRDNGLPGIRVERERRRRKDRRKSVAAPA